MRIATYCRVSSEAQTVDPQTIELRNFCAGKGWEVVEEFVDVVSGGKTTREGLERLMACVRERRCDAVMTVKLDRLARSLSHFAQLIEEFGRHGVAFIATSQGIDTSKANPAGILQMHVLAAVAQFERSLIRERTISGLVAARARGKVLGHPSAKLVGVDVPAVVAAWRGETDGFDVRLLARRLGGVSVSTAWRIAKKEGEKP